MKDFNYYLDYIGEIGYVERIMHSIVYSSGLPGVHPFEAVYFEDGNIGQVISVSKEGVEILLLRDAKPKVGTKVARTGGMLELGISDELMGRLVNPLGERIDKGEAIIPSTYYPADTQPHGIMGRKDVDSPFETGVSIIDLLVPLGKGQRELVIGDRKTGKTEFLLQTLLHRAKSGNVCIYCIIGQRQEDIKRRCDFIKNSGIADKCIVIASSSSDSSGLIYLTPFSAMTIAEHFRDKGNDVLVILDDMTTHARCYREISLLAKRFPGRGSYPGDIFYLHSRIMERAGNFKKGSITCIPVAESVMGDLSGYLQTNLMAMTDGHIFFDIDYYNQGKRPSINPFLSVSRVGHEPQTPLLKDVNKQLISFLVDYERMKQFMHFGAEAGETVKGVIGLGKKIDAFLQQSTKDSIPVSVNVVILGGIWAGIWTDIEVPEMKTIINKIILEYKTNAKFKKKIDETLLNSKIFSDLINFLRLNPEILLV